ncbi:MAG: site-specific integrase [Chloroflexales bacterium]|nr:site-specific integrase [Chloroflexales bacterium]
MPPGAPSTRERGRARAAAGRSRCHPGRPPLPGRHQHPHHPSPLRRDDATRRREAPSPPVPPLASGPRPRRSLDQASKLQACAFELEHASPHALRHSLAYRLIEDGASLAAVQRILRHSRGEQTLRYTTPNDHDLKDGIDRSGGV